MMKLVAFAMVLAVAGCVEPDYSGSFWMLGTLGDRCVGETQVFAVRPPDLLMADDRIGNITIHVVGQYGTNFSVTLPTTHYTSDGDERWAAQTPVLTKPGFYAAHARIPVNGHFERAEYYFYVQECDR